MVFVLMFKVLLLLAVGYLAAWRGWISKEGRHSMSELLVNVILPASMLASSQDEFSREHLQGILLIGAIALIYYLVVFVIGGLAKRLFQISEDSRVITILMVAFANTGFVGLPIVRELAGDTGMLYGAIYNVVFDVIYFSYGLYLLQGQGKGIKSVLKNPIIWISLLAVVLYVIPFRFPSFIREGMELIAATMMPISMFIIGSQIYGIKIKEIMSNTRAMLISFLRMAIAPGITFVIMYFLRIDTTVAVVAVILSAMPTASLNVIMAERYNKEPELAAVTVMQNTLLMIITLPVFMYLTQYL